MGGEVGQEGRVAGTRGRRRVARQTGTSAVFAEVEVEVGASNATAGISFESGASSSDGHPLPELWRASIESGCAAALEFLGRSSAVTVTDVRATNTDTSPKALALAASLAVLECVRPGVAPNVGAAALDWASVYGEASPAVAELLEVLAGLGLRR